MTVSTGTYGSFWDDLYNNLLDLAAVKVMLVLDAHVPDFDLDNRLDDIIADKVVGTTDQGVLATLTTTIDTGSNEVELDFSTAVMTFTAVASGSVGGILCYDSTNGTDATRELISLNAFSGGAVTANGGDIVVTLGTEGIVKVTY